MFPEGDIVIRDLLERGATERPDESFLHFEDGTTWTRAEALEAAHRAGNVLRTAGVRQGDRVSVFLPNGKAFLRAWWGAAVLGAVVVPVNTGYRGNMLAGHLDLAKPVVLITDADLGGRLEDTKATAVYTRLDAECLTEGNAEPVELERPLFFGDSELLVTTSGTTGPSKLVATSYLHNFLGGSHWVNAHGRGAEERILIDLPMYHSASVYVLTAALTTGASLVVRSGPAMSNYWEVLRDNGVTMALMLSTMLPFLRAREPRKAEREHNLRSILVAPVPADADGFLKRFGIEEMWTTLGSTEIPGPIVSVAGDELLPGYCGRQRDGYECRVVDANDIELPAGQPGELIVRADMPWSMSPSYEDNPEATAAAWRNGWFHTGDMVTRDERGRFFYVDRIKDALRRRGENISSMEVEAEVGAHPLVAEVACVPHRLEGGTEDEVKIWVVPVEGGTVEPRELFEFCADRLPHFMVPRFIEVTDQLPRTPSQRIRKFELREKGNGAAAWDSEAAGLRATRQGVKRVGGGVLRGRA